MKYIIFFVVIMVGAVKSGTEKRSDYIKKGLKHTETNYSYWTRVNIIEIGDSVNIEMINIRGERLASVKTHKKQLNIHEAGKLPFNLIKR